jgi:hypothetical protein
MPRRPKPIKPPGPSILARWSRQRTALDRSWS